MVYLSSFTGYQASKMSDPELAFKVTQRKY